jgi:hypothetical protein
MADDEVTSVGIPPDDGPSDPTIQTETRAEDAPWGYKADGTPYKVDPARYARRDAKRRKASPGPKKATAKRSVYAESVTDLMVLVSGGLAIAAKGSGNAAFLADAIVVEESAPDVGDAFGKLADQNDKVARMLDKLGEVGPYGLVLAAMAPIVTQCMANHGMLPAGMMGTEDPQAMIERKLGPMVNNGEQAA